MRRCALALACAAAALACGGGGGSSSSPPHEVSGVMTTSAGTDRDSDVNDLLAVFTPNDDAATAQQIRNPVTLGGHVNRPGRKPSGAPDGRTTAAGDLQDWFRVPLAAGQLVRLLIAENGTTNDLDLELRATDQSLVAHSAGSTRVEEISVPATGDYYVVVVAAAGFSNYTLAIGQMPTSGSTAASEPEFVPGQVLVRYRERPRGAAQAGPASLAAGVGMRHLAGSPDGPMLFAAESAAERAEALRALGLGVSRSPGGADTDARRDTLRLVEALRARPEIRSADPNYLRRPLAAPADEYFPLQWHYDLINLPVGWDAVSDDSGVVVAVLDTGIKAGHPDLASQIVPGFDFITSASRSNDGNGCDDDPEDAGDLSAGGSSFHGTHVAGTVAARTSFQDGNTDGVAGVAWNADVMPLRVLGIGGGTDADILAALRYSVGLDNACMVAPAQTADIANMSFGGPGFSQTFQDAITELRGAPHHLILVAAAGNDASSAPSYPAAFDGVISVSAVGPTRTLAPYSNTGSAIDVAAPGGDFSRDVDGDGFPDGVLSTFFDEGTGGFTYAFFQGTSMAAPHVAGVLALMLGIDPALTPVDIDNALVLGEITEDIGPATSFGNGLIHAAKAVNRAAAGGSGGVPTAVLRVDPGGLNFGLLGEELVASASNGGNDDQPLNVQSVSFTSDDGAPWLSITDESDPATGLGDYRLTLDRGALADGLYTGALAFVSDKNDVDVPVIMQVGHPSAAVDDAGHQYVLLVDVDTLETRYAVALEPDGGRYFFDFDETVADGEYLVVAGTDFDNDLLICDAGEACGVFPTIDSPTPVRVDRDRNDLAFATGFAPSLGASAAAGPAATGYAVTVGARPPAPQPERPPAADR